MKFEIDKTKGSVLIFDAMTPEERRSTLSKMRERCFERAGREFGVSEELSGRIDTELTLMAGTISETTLAVACEIAATSAKMGYPVNLNGDESGFLTAYLLGISNVHPKQYDFSTLPLDLYAGQKTNTAFLKTLELAVAEPVRKKLIPALQKKFGRTEGDHNCNCKIRLPYYTALDEIGKLASLTGIGFEEIALDTPAVLSAVCEDIIKEEIGSDDLLQMPCKCAPKFYAFAVCTSRAVKDRALFEAVSDYLFREDVYDELVGLGFEKGDALRMSRLWSRGEKRAAEINVLRARNAPKALIDSFDYMSNLWEISGCISRTNIKQMLKYYEINYPKEYKKVTRDRSPDTFPGGLIRITVKNSPSTGVNEQTDT